MDILENGVAENSDCIGDIGKSLYTPDPTFVGAINDFWVYNYAKTEQEMREENTKTDAEIVANAKNSRTIPNQSDVRGNITLPAQRMRVQ